MVRTVAESARKNAGWNMSDRKANRAMEANTCAFLPSK